MQRSGMRLDSNFDDEILNAIGPSYLDLRPVGGSELRTACYYTNSQNNGLGLHSAGLSENSAAESEEEHTSSSRNSLSPGNSPSEGCAKATV